MSLHTVRSLVSHSELEALQHRLLKGLRHKPEPYGAGPESSAAVVIDSYLDHGSVDRVEAAMRHCEPEFLRAFRAIIRYSPQLTGQSSRKTFREFMAHKARHPHFYQCLCHFAKHAAENGVHVLPPSVLIGRTIWELAVVKRESACRRMNANIISHYCDYWTLDNPEVNFRFNHRNANGFQGRRNFIENDDLDQG